MDFMALLKKVWPLAWSVEKKNLQQMIVQLIVHVVVCAIAGVLIGILAAIPVIGIIIGILGGLVDLYCLIAIVIILLKYFDILK